MVVQGGVVTVRGLHRAVLRIGTNLVKEAGVGRGTARIAGEVEGIVQLRLGVGVGVGIGPGMKGVEVTPGVVLDPPHAPGVDGSRVEGPIWKLLIPSDLKGVTLVSHWGGCYLVMLRDKLAARSSCDCGSLYRKPVSVSFNCIVAQAFTVVAAI